MLEAVRIRKSGYEFRMYFAEFCKRYQRLG